MRGVLGSIQPLAGGSAREPPLVPSPGASTRQYFQDAGYSESRARAKAEEVRRGSELRQQKGVYPENRSCQDVGWVLLFFVVFLAMLSLSVYYQVRFITHPPTFGPSTSDFEGRPHNSPPHVPGNGAHLAGPYSPRGSHNAAVTHLRHLAAVVGPKSTGAHDDISGLIDVNQLARLLLTTSFVAGAGGILVVYPFLLLAHKYANTVVHIALILGPVSMIISGVSMLAASLVGGEFAAMLFIMGFLCLAFGVCSLALVMCRWGQLIPFTVRVVKVVAGVAKRFPALLLAPLLGGFVGNLWVLMSGMVFLGVASDHYQMMQQSSSDPDITKAQVYGAVFVMALVLYWGVEVAHCLSHVTICGVYGQWYFGKDVGRSKTAVVLSSLKVALVTSFGSICLGSFLVAFIRGVEAVARQIELDARRNENRVLQCLAVVVRCVLGCIGDILEYFNEWAYVQCAIRGVGFFQAAKITYSICTLANVRYIMSSWLVGNVVWLGALFSAVVGGLLGALVGLASGSAIGAQAGLVIGFASAFASGRAAMCVISSGTKTILTCWAESPATLREKEDAEEAELAEDFERPRRWVSSGGVLMNSRPEGEA
mmetsp:Transcript_4074/g.8741  ORF Transcript_4074/g.8741 Transcript_4074/m.8741 type:complete len:596 (+) Transcript_4074:177-1964(+)|eukprot:CAMPEP_0178416492 /NCGR_PEP_ID=MMETSP0689_2-20121128/24091_1 /TAXON_ID=160604 /ORGANISM="Amphidinium massartii, Strain CS-259" /LENGTH=595 /DNA_ID=CAMNT_0020037837 /DNA_START=145 /DNA_END=1932 /DNA_ORIENTATION=-